MTERRIIRWVFLRFSLVCAKHLWYDMDISLQQEEIIMKRLFCFFLIFMLAPAAFAATPSQTSLYYDGVLDQQDTLHFDAQGQLTHVNAAFPGMGEEITMTFQYDGEGRILYADREDFWVYFGNDAYEYDSQGRLIRHEYYWGGGALPYRQSEYTYDASGRRASLTTLYPDANDENMEISTIYDYVYLLDEEGRVKESHQLIRHTTAVYTMQTEYGKYPANENVVVTQYTYDSEDRVLTMQSVDLPLSLYDPQGHDLAPDAGSTVTYYYDYAPFIIYSYGDDGATVCLTDSAGTEIWSMYAPDHFQVDGDRLVRAIDPEYDTRLEFTYAD